MKKILVIRFSSIGDIVLTTPVIRSIKRQLDDAELHFLTKKQFLPIVRANPCIDKIFTIEKSIDEVIPELKKVKYDHIIDLHKNFRSKGVILKLARPASSFNKINVRKWLSVKLKKTDLLPDIHIVDRYFQAVEHLGINNDGKGLDYFIPENDEVDTGILPESHRNGYIGWVIGATYFTKTYPDDRIIEICKKIEKPVVLLGGGTDAGRGKKIAEAVGNKVYNSCGKFNINQSASLVKQADRIVTNDTGLMHIAAAFRKEIVSLWGNTIPEFGMHPYLPEDEGKSIILEVKNLSCRPCGKLGFQKCPKDHFNCMRKIEIEKIIRFINR